MCVNCELFLFSLFSDTGCLASSQCSKNISIGQRIGYTHTDRTHTCCCVHLHLSIPMSITCMQWRAFCLTFCIRLYPHMRVLCPAFVQVTFLCINPHCPSSVLPFCQYACLLFNLSLACFVIKLSPRLHPLLLFPVCCVRPSLWTCHMLVWELHRSLPRILSVLN